MNRAIVSRFATALFLLTGLFQAGAATVWTGPNTTFTKLAGADPTQPANQDRLTSSVWLTRGSTQGLYNANSEGGFTHFLSPAGTEWANGSLANYASLTYQNWNSWAKGVNAGPPSTVGVDAVVHLITDDIYLSVKFTSWDSGAGGFSYIRSTPGTTPPPPPKASLKGVFLAGNAGFQLSFTNSPGYTFSVLSTTNVALPASSWSVIGTVTDAPPGSGSYVFIDATATNGSAGRFYQVRWP